MGLFTNEHFHRHTYNSNVHITEKRAPTDESAKLLKELQREAEKLLKEQISVPNNVFEFGCFEVYDKFDLRPGFQFYLQFKLNGKDYTLKDNINKPYDKGEIFRELIKKACDRVSEAIFQELINTDGYKDFIARLR